MNTDITVQAGQNVHSLNTNFDLQNSSNVNANRGIYIISCLGQLNDNVTMLFPKVNKITFILQCNTSLSKKYVAHSITVVSAISWIWEKGILCSLAICAYHMKLVVEQRFFHKFAFDNICRILNLLKTFEVRTLSNSNFVTSPSIKKCSQLK